MVEDKTFNTIQKLTAVISTILYIARHNVTGPLFKYDYKTYCLLFYKFSKEYPDYFERCYWDETGHFSYSPEIDDIFTTMNLCGMTAKTLTKPILIIFRYTCRAPELLEDPNIITMAKEFEQFYLGDV